MQRLFDTKPRLSQERELMIELLRAGACAAAADAAIVNQLQTEDANTTALEAQRRVLALNAAKIKEVLKFAEPHESIEFAKRFSSYYIDKYRLSDPATEQRAFFQKCTAADKTSDDLWNNYISGKSTKHATELSLLFDLLIASNSWSTLQSIFVGLSDESKSAFLKDAGYHCNSAVKNGSVNVVKMLIAVGMKPNCYLSFRGFFGDTQTACLMVYVIAHIRSLAHKIDDRNKHSEPLIECPALTYDISNNDERFKRAIANLHEIIDMLLKAGANVDMPDYGYSSKPSDPDYVPRGMARKTLRESVDGKKHLTDEQKQLLGNVLRLIINPPTLQQGNEEERVSKRRNTQNI